MLDCPNAVRLVTQSRTSPAPFIPDTAESWPAGLDTLAEAALPDFLLLQRWYPAKDCGRPEVRLALLAPLTCPGVRAAAAVWRVTPPDRPPLYMFVPLALAPATAVDAAQVIVSLPARQHGAPLALVEATALDEFLRAWVSFLIGSEAPAPELHAGHTDHLASADLAMSLPLLFALIALRAWLPLDVSPLLSVVATFITLGLLGWPSSLRVVWAASRNLRDSDHILFAQALGYRRTQLLFRQAFPCLRPVFLAQFWISIPLFILTEATLSMLGLGVMEPLPSWGNLLRGSEDFSAMTANPWRLVPLFVVVLTVICFQFIFPGSEELA